MAIIFKSHYFGTSVAQVIIRNIEEDVKTGLEARANKHGWSMEEEVRQILRQAVRPDGLARTKLGSHIAAHFAGAGITEPLPELNGQMIDPINVFTSPFDFDPLTVFVDGQTTSAGHSLVAMRRQDT